MFDTMTLTKAGGALCGTLLVFLLGNWAAEILYATEAGGHGGEEYQQAYVIETGEEDAGAAIDGSNATGPHLDGVVNRAVGTVDGFSYSGAMAAVFDTWTPEHLNTFLESPKGAAPGTKMSFSGLKKAEDRANLVAYLESLGG